MSCLLLLYLITATPIAPLVIALLAGMDRSHHVTIQSGEHGIQVVLRHDHVNPTTHRHGMVAQTLTVFARRSSAPQSDHIIQFGSTDVARQAPAVTIESACDSPAPNEDSVAGLLSHPSDVTFGCADFPRPPPVTSDLLLAVRSTVLLI